MEIPIMKPRLPEVSQITAYMRRVQESQIYSNHGPLVKELELRLSKFFKVSDEQVVVCANATLGLMGAISVTDEKSFLAPAFTFPASLLAVHYAGKKLSVLDVSKDTWEIEENPDFQFDSSSWGVLRVLPFGAPVNFRNFRSYGSVVIDAAASFGSETSDLSQIPHNNSVVYSFHATKVLGVGEGACVVFGSIKKAREFRSWINFGFNGDRNSVSLGLNAKMSEYTAAVGLTALDNWEVEKSEWFNVKTQAREVDRGIGIESLVGSFQGVSPYWIVEYADEDRANNAMSKLRDSNVGVRRWWGLGCHRMPAFSQYIDRDFPNTDSVANRTFGLPFFRDMEANDFSYIRNVLLKL